MEAELSVAPPTPAARLYIGGLSTDITADDLTSRFSAFGAVLSCDFRSKGSMFAYVELQPKDVGSVKQCLKVYNNSKWRGCHLTVELAQPDYLRRLQLEWEEDDMINNNEASNNATLELQNLPPDSAVVLSERGEEDEEGAQGREEGKEKRQEKVEVYHPPGVPLPFDKRNPMTMVLPGRRHRKLFRIPLDGRLKEKPKKFFPPSKESLLGQLSWSMGNVSNSSISKRNETVHLPSIPYKPKAVPVAKEGVAWKPPTKLVTQQPLVRPHETHELLKLLKVVDKESKKQEHQMKAAASVRATKAAEGSAGAKKAMPEGAWEEPAKEEHAVVDFLDGEEEGGYKAGLVDLGRFGSSDDEDGEESGGGRGTKVGSSVGRGALDHFGSSDDGEEGLEEEVEEDGGGMVDGDEEEEKMVSGDEEVEEEEEEDDGGMEDGDEMEEGEEQTGSGGDEVEEEKGGGGGTGLSVEDMGASSDDLEEEEEEEEELIALGDEAEEPAMEEGEEEGIDDGMMEGGGGEEEGEEEELIAVGDEEDELTLEEGEEMGDGMMEAGEEEEVDGDDDDDDVAEEEEEEISLEEEEEDELAPEEEGEDEMGGGMMDGGGEEDLNEEEKEEIPFEEAEGELAMEEEGEEGEEGWEMDDDMMEGGDKEEEVEEDEEQQQRPRRGVQADVVAVAAPMGAITHPKASPAPPSRAPLAVVDFVPRINRSQTKSARADMSKFGSDSEESFHDVDDEDRPPASTCSSRGVAAVGVRQDRLKGAQPKTSAGVADSAAKIAAPKSVATKTAAPAAAPKTATTNTTAATGAVAPPKTDRAKKAAAAAKTGSTQGEQLGAIAQAPQSANKKVLAPETRQVANQAPQGANKKTTAPQAPQAATQAPQAANKKKTAPQAPQAAREKLMAPQAAKEKLMAPQAANKRPMDTQAPQSANKKTMAASLAKALQASSLLSTLQAMAASDEAKEDVVLDGDDDDEVEEEELPSTRKGFQNSTQGAGGKPKSSDTKKETKSIIVSRASDSRASSETRSAGPASTSSAPSDAAPSSKGKLAPSSFSFSFFGAPSEEAGEKVADGSETTPEVLGRRWATPKPRTIQPSASPHGRTFPGARSNIDRPAISPGTVTTAAPAAATPGTATTPEVRQSVAHGTAAVRNACSQPEAAASLGVSTSPPAQRQSHHLSQPTQALNPTTTAATPTTTPAATTPTIPNIPHAAIPTTPTIPPKNTATTTTATPAATTPTIPTIPHSAPVSLAAAFQHGASFMRDQAVGDAELRAAWDAQREGLTADYRQKARTAKKHEAASGRAAKKGKHEHRR